MAQTIIRAERHREPVLQHLPERMVLDRLEARRRLEVRCEADLHSDAPVGDVLHKLIHVPIPVHDLGIPDLVSVEHPGPMPDTVSMTLRNRLED